VHARLEDVIMEGLELKWGAHVAKLEIAHPQLSVREPRVPSKPVHRPARGLSRDGRHAVPARVRGRCAWWKPRCPLCTRGLAGSSSVRSREAARGLDPTSRTSALTRLACCGQLVGDLSGG
jgi:hypothetical protein